MQSRKLLRILIANRGEIACRIIHSAKRYGLYTIAVYAEDEPEALHVRLADKGVRLEGKDLSDTYLNINQIVSVAVECQADAIHPGYGFLSENYFFAQACQDHGIIFLGPEPDCIHFMGNKIGARNHAVILDIPVLPTVYGDHRELMQRASELKFPLIVKAAAGGGGKGMKIIESPEQLEKSLEGASREALSYFADGTVYLEEYIADARHIEVQVFGNGQGQVIHLFERECSIQRRYQKIMEEAPSPSIDNSLREYLTELAVRFAASRNYASAGTVEFILSPNNQVFFLEMNTRIQVEHPVTELITGIDIVQLQFILAETGSLPIQQADIRFHGHAIEARIYAEDPFSGFIPSTGMIDSYLEPAMKEVRIDGSMDGPTMISENYDPLLAKVIAHGNDREEARKKLLKSLNNFVLTGILTNIPYLKLILEQDVFIKGKYNTGFVEEEHFALSQNYKDHKSQIPPELLAIVWVLAEIHRAPASKGPVSYKKIWIEQHPIDIFLFTIGGIVAFEINGEMINPTFKWAFPWLRIVWKGLSYEAFCSTDAGNEGMVGLDGMLFRVYLKSEEFLGLNRQGTTRNSNGDSEIIAPLHGKIVKLEKSEGDLVRKGDRLLVLEAMKMENNLLAGRDGVISEIYVKPGDQVKKGQLLVRLKN